MRIQWDAATMATGIGVVDAQHQKLVQTLNELIEAMRQGRGKEEIEPILAWLGDYAAKHFLYEESCMTQYRCPSAAANKAAHAEFIRLFSSFRERFAQQKATTSLVLEIEQKLALWLRDHICKIDRQLGGCVHKVA